MRLRFYVEVKQICIYDDRQRMMMCHTVEGPRILQYQDTSYGGSEWRDVPTVKEEV